MTRRKYKLKFGFAGILALAITVLAIGGIGFTVFRNSSDLEAITATSTEKDSAPSKKEQAQEVNTQQLKQQIQADNAERKHYTNEKYGISFDYPVDWKVESSDIPPQMDSPLPTIFGATVSRTTSEKYSATAVIEIYSKGFESIRAWFVKASESRGNTQVDIQDGQAKGKKMTSIVRTSTAADGTIEVQKQYLFSVDNITYSLRSINEWLGVYTDPNYYKKFDSIYDSLTIK